MRVKHHPRHTVHIEKWKWKDSKWLKNQIEPCCIQPLINPNYDFICIQVLSALINNLRCTYCMVWCSTINRKQHGDHFTLQHLHAVYYYRNACIHVHIYLFVVVHMHLSVGLTAMHIKHWAFRCHVYWSVYLPRWVISPRILIWNGSQFHSSVFSKIR